MTRRAALYLRISDDRTGRALGVERQRADCEKLAVEKGWTIAEIFTDNDVSASTRKPRPAYDAMLAALEAGHVDAVVVWDADRLTRRPVELEAFIDLRDRLGFDLASVGGEIDLSKPQGRLIARIKGNVARHEVEQMSARIRRAHDDLRAAGRPANGGLRPYGYTQDRLNVVPEEAAVIREAAERVLAGEALGAIARDFGSRGLMTSRGQSWAGRRDSLRGCLLSGRIAGRASHRGADAGDAAWPAIIDMQTHRALTAVLTDPARRPTRGKGRQNLLSGLATCGLCGHALIAAWVVGHKRLVYKCPPKPHGCGRILIAGVPLDELISELVLARVAQAEVVSTDPIEDGAAASGVIAECEAKLAELGAAFASGDVDLIAMREAGKVLRSRMESARAELATLPQMRTRERYDRLVLEAAWPGMGVDERLRVIRAFLTDVRVSPATRRGPGFNPERVSVVWR